MTHHASARRSTSCVASVARFVVLMGSVAVLATHAGCYKRVVKAEGLGASTITVQEPRRTDGPIERAVYGGDSSGTRKNRPSGYTPRK